MDEELNSSWLEVDVDYLREAWIDRLINSPVDQRSIIDYRKQARDKLATWHVSLNNEHLLNQAWDEARAMNEAFDLAKTVAAAPTKPAGRL